MVRAEPTDDMLSPSFFMFSPVLASFCNATADWSACFSSFSSCCSVAMISLCRASYCCCEISPLASFSLACWAASFNCCNFSFVSETACANSLCFCVISSVLPGSSFNRLLTSRSCDWVLLISELTDFKAVESFVVSPPISTVIPAILFAICFPPPKNKHEKSTYPKVCALIIKKS